ncbi:MAG TPA: hypothetical protein VJS92_03375 [Candidatus Polarisedimenticolaceae bacterium]|nr:hypothetical protein [Candidatus Polarisedimenticolaceae bacterium]
MKALHGWFLVAAASVAVRGASPLPCDFALANFRVQRDWLGTKKFASWDYKVSVLPGATAPIHLVQVVRRQAADGTWTVLGETYLGSFAATSSRCSTPGSPCEIVVGCPENGSHKVRGACAEGLCTVERAAFAACDTFGGTQGWDANADTLEVELCQGRAGCVATESPRVQRW